MKRIVSFKVWSILVLVLLCGLGELTAEAKLLSGRRQRCCCPSSCETSCPAPCNPCGCESRDPSRVCVMELLFGYPGYWVYSAHHHENGTECPEYSAGGYESSILYEDLPMLCSDSEPENECLEYFRPSDPPLPGLREPVDADEDLMALMATSTATKLDELAGNLTIASGRTIHARVLLLKLKAKIKAGGVVKEVTEYFGFGFESAPTGKDDFNGFNVVKHKIGGKEQQHLYEFMIGTTKCIVVTTTP